MVLNFHTSRCSLLALTLSESAETMPFTFNRCHCDNADSTFNSHLEVLRPTWAPQGQGIVHQGRDGEIGQRKQIVLAIGKHSVCVSIMDQKCSLEELPDLDVPRKMGRVRAGGLLDTGTCRTLYKGQI